MITEQQKNRYYKYVEYLKNGRKYEYARKLFKSYKAGIIKKEDLQQYEIDILNIYFFKGSMKSDNRATTTKNDI